MDGRNTVRDSASRGETCGFLTGVGFKVTKKFAKNLPAIRNDIEVINKPYKPLPVEQRIEHTQLHDMSNGYVKIWVGDSKEGWVEALRYYLEVLTLEKYEHVRTIIFSYNSIRERGAKLNTFGGTASGPEPLMEMFLGIDGVVKGKIDPSLAPPKTAETKQVGDHTLTYVQLRPIHLLDIGNLIGNNVVVGGKQTYASNFKKHSSNSVELLV